VADKKHIKRTINGLQRIKTWQLVVLLLLAVFLAATFLRLNNIGMVQRREAVLSADENGDEQIIIQRLYDLQQYVSSHMNTSLGNGIYLEASYYRDYQALVDQASNTQNSNGNIYKKAQQVCAPQYSQYSAGYVQCTLRELDKYPAATELKSEVEAPPAELYRHSFSSPLWTPDFAGWSVLICVVLVLMILARLITLLILRAMLHHHYKGA
jgi:hypothetical protein